jgi:DNA repair exonuclease SbcCD ATPase subunit
MLLLSRIDELKSLAQDDMLGPKTLSEIITHVDSSATRLAEELELEIALLEELTTKLKVLSSRLRSYEKALNSPSFVKVMAKVKEAFNQQLEQYVDKFKRTIGYIL